jgi:endonuclease I
MKNHKTISYQSWDNRIKRIQTKIKKENKTYKNLGYYHHLMNPCILEVQSDKGTILIDENKYNELRENIIEEAAEEKRQEAMLRAWGEF